MRSRSAPSCATATPAGCSPTSCARAAAVVAEGGRGWPGQHRLRQPHRRLPSFAERGEKVEERSLRLELKLIADVGLVGFPSAGKSSLVGRLSAAPRGSRRGRSRP
jgi:GTPase involved in cell partitioning and DNA repair